MNAWEKFRKYGDADPMDRLYMKKGNEDYRITVCPGLKPLEAIMEKKKREVEALNQRLTRTLFIREASDEQVRAHNLAMQGTHETDEVYQKLVRTKRVFEGWATENSKGMYGRGRDPLEDALDGAQKRLAQRRMGQEEYSVLSESSPEQIIARFAPETYDLMNKDKPPKSASTICDRIRDITVGYAN